MPLTINRTFQSSSYAYLIQTTVEITKYTQSKKILNSDSSNHQIHLTENAYFQQFQHIPVLTTPRYLLILETDYQPHATYRAAL